MNEPLFRNIDSKDREVVAAHARASSTISEFIELVQVAEDVTCMAKLRFKDPDLSLKRGEDQFLYIWLTHVVYHLEEKLLSGVFFEVPTELQKWHQVGQRLGFEADDVFDWMVNDNGHVRGGFTLRVTRSRLGTDSEKAEFDNYSGIISYDPIDE